MFNALMKVQWKWSRIAVLVAVVIGFGIPLGGLSMLRSIRGSFEGDLYGSAPLQIIQMMQGFGVMYAFLAAGIGMALALIGWMPDHRGRHVYALSLPVARGRYATMRYGAGALFLIPPAIGVLLGALIMIAMVQVPAGMHAYPLSLTLRFLISSFVAYSIFFMVAASTQRAAAVILGSIGAFMLLSMVFAAFGSHYDLFGKGYTLLFSEPGLLSIFTGRWMLIDV